MLSKPKNYINRFDGVLILGLVLALITLIIHPKNVVRAQNENLAKNSTDLSNYVSISVFEESQESNMFYPEIEKPDKVIKSVLTGYSSTPDQTDSSPFIAASGKYVYDGMVANNCLPFGTQIKIPNLFGEKIFTVHDRMNRRYGCSRFDIWMDAPRKEVLQFGVKRADVEIFYVKKEKELAKK